MVVPSMPEAKAKKTKHQLTDLLSGVNDNKAFHRLLIPTIYWHVGNQHDVWFYDDDWVIGTLNKVCLAIYTPANKPKVDSDGVIFGLVSNQACLANDANKSLKTSAHLSDWIHKIGSAGVTMVNKYMMEKFKNDDHCQKYAEWAMKDYWFLW